MLKKLLIAVFICLSISLLFFSCAKSKTSTTSIWSPQSGQSGWWDKFGEPKYGGTITYRVSSLSPNFDNTTWFFADYDYWWDTMWVRVNWTADRNTWAFRTDFTPETLCTGVLAESWEQPDMQTIIVHIRKGVHFQNKPPVNGRELTAYDVQAHYDRILGTGSGYTRPAMMYGMFTANFDRVTARDKYTVVYKFKKPSAFSLLSLTEPLAHNAIEPPEWVALGGPPKNEPAAPAGPPGGGPGPGGPPPMPKSGPLSDWHNAVGSGPWMLTDYKSGTSMTFSRNPDYWGRDERYPKNQVPYADTFKITNIPDTATAVAALRTGKIDVMTDLNWRQTQSLEKSNPDLQLGKVPGAATGIQFRSDKAPFTDIRVRKALDMSIDRNTMAKIMYGGTVDEKPIGIVNPAFKEYCYLYDDWPQKLKDEYKYNPEGAKKLLAEAGYPKGFKTNTIAPTASPNLSLEVIQAMQGYFKRIGVDMQIRLMDWAQYGNFASSGKHDQMSVQGSGSTWPPNRTIQTYDSRTPDNSAHNNDAGYDALVDNFWAATSPADIVKITRQLDKYSIEKHWAVNTFATVTFNAWQPYLKGYSGETHLAWGGGYLWARLWVDQDLKNK